MTEKKNVAEVLRALASGSKNRSQTARLRDIIVEVEAMAKFLAVRAYTPNSGKTRVAGYAKRGVIATANIFQLL